MEKRVLLVDDDPVFIRRMRLAIDGAIDLRVTSVAQEAVTIYTTWRPDLILLDVHITPGDSFKILDDLTSGSLAPPVAVLCLSRGPGATTHIQNFGDNIFGTLKREIDRHSLVAAIALALRQPDPVAA